MANLKRTREDILTSAIDLVHRRGLRSTGLKDLFAATHASSGSFYNYFRSKDEFAHALIDMQWQQIKQNASLSATQVTDDPIERLFLTIDKIESKYLPEIDYAGCPLGNLIVDLVEYNDTFRKHLQQVFDDWQELFAQMLRDGKDQLRDRIDPNLLAEQILTMLEGVLLIARLYNEPERLKRGFANIRKLIKDALI